MRTKRIDAATLIATNLGPAEDALGEAALRLFALGTAMLTARASSGVSRLVGQEAMDLVGTATSHITKAQTALVAAHHRLAETKIEIGLGPVAFGDLVDCPKTAADRNGPADLHLVA